MSTGEVAAVLARHRSRLMAVPGVVGVAEGARGGRPCILVLVGHRTPALEAAVPAELEGVPVELCDTGPITAASD